MTLAQIARYRMLNQHIAVQKHATPRDVLRHLCALQAQDYAGGKWSVGVRLPGIADDGVEQAIADKQIVRTWSFRGTLHFMAPDHLRSILQVICPRVLGAAGTNFRKYGMDTDGSFVKSHKVIGKVLHAGKCLTRGQLVDVLQEKGVNTEGLRAGFLLLEASLTGLICQGPRDGKEFTFVLLEEWLPKEKLLPREETIALLAEKYFISHGPAVLSDFVYWSGLTVTDAKAGLEIAKKHLAKETIGGQEYWMPQDMPAPGKTGSVYLLPGFDEYILGYKDRLPALSPEHMKKVVASGNGIFNPTIVIDGKVAGLWKRTIKKDIVIVELQPFEPLNKTEQKKSEAAASDFAKFLGMRLELI